MCAHKRNSRYGKEAVVADVLFYLVQGQLRFVDCPAITIAFRWPTFSVSGSCSQLLYQDNEVVASDIGGWCSNPGKDA